MARTTGSGGGEPYVHIASQRNGSGTEYRHYALIFCDAAHIKGASNAPFVNYLTFLSPAGAACAVHQAALCPTDADTPHCSWWP